MQKNSLSCNKLKCYYLLTNVTINTRVNVWKKNQQIWIKYCSRKWHDTFKAEDVILPSIMKLWALQQTVALHTLPTTVTAFFLLFQILTFHHSQVSLDWGVPEQDWERSHTVTDNFPPSFFFSFFPSASFWGQRNGGGPLSLWPLICQNRKKISLLPSMRNVV